MKSIYYLIIVAAEVLLLAGLMIRDRRCDAVSRSSQLDNARLVNVLRITDLALWTEARYARHPSQADCFSAFQEGPVALDHFPSGTWVPPARHRHNVGAFSAGNP